MRLLQKKAFTLIEILLVIGVIMIMSIIKIRDINDETEDMQAKMLASQIQTVADATNAFLVLKYHELSNLSSSGVSCNSGTNTCNITLQNLNDNALLPPNFSSTTILGNPYEIQLKRTGASPNYMMAGVVLTKANKNTENTSSLVFSGKVLRDIGRDGGLNKTEGKIIGTSNGWSADSSLFPVLSGKTGYVGSAVGTLSGAYYVYLRRDGTLPMTGDLNLDGHNIKNVNNLTATGALTTTGNISGANISATGTVHANGELTTNSNVRANGTVNAKNGYGDSIALGGDAAGNDYEIKLSNGTRPLSIYSPNALDYTTTLKNAKNVSIGQRLGLMGYDPNDLPSGWGGGLRTLDVYAAGTVATGSNGQLTSYMNATGVHTTQNITASGNITGNYIKSNGNLDANGRVNVGEFVYINGQASIGGGCSPNGLQGRTPEGALLSCVSGVWKTAKSKLESYSFMLNGNHPNYGNSCEQTINNNGMSSQGWIITGSDACTEDNEYCTIDNIKCYAARVAE